MYFIKQRLRLYSFFAQFAGWQRYVFTMFFIIGLVCFWYFICFFPLSYLYAEERSYGVTLQKRWKKKDSLIESIEEKQVSLKRLKKNNEFAQQKIMAVFLDEMEKSGCELLSFVPQYTKEKSDFHAKECLVSMKCTFESISAFFDALDKQSIPMNYKMFQLKKQDNILQADMLISFLIKKDA